MARGRARWLTIIKTGTSTCAYSNSLCATEKRQKSGVTMADEKPKVSVSVLYQNISLFHQMCVKGLVEKNDISVWCVSRC